MAKSLTEVKIEDFLPSSLENIDVVLNTAAVIDPHLQTVAELALTLPFMSDFSSVSDDWKDALAWQMHVDLWAYTGLLHNKVNVLEDAILSHRKRGTVWAVENALQFAGISGNVSEWYEYDGEPYHFRITLNTASPSEALIERVKNMVYTAKNLRSWFDGIEAQDTGALGYQYTAGYATVKNSYTITQEE